MSAEENAKRNGQPCARCGMKDGAHNWRNRHPKACTEWLTAAELREDRSRDDELWFFEAGHGEASG